MLLVEAPVGRRRHGVHTAYVLCAREFIREREHFPAAVDQAYEAPPSLARTTSHGWDFDIVVHHGAGAYICGEGRDARSLGARKASPA